MGPLTALLILCAATAAAEPSSWRRVEVGPVLAWQPLRVTEGEVVVVEAQPSTRCEGLRARWRDDDYVPYPVGERLHFLLPTELGDTSTHTLSLACGDAALEPQLRIEVMAGSFPESKLSVDPKYTREPPPRVVEERAAIEAAFAFARERMWTRSFVRPAPAVETSPYGVRRTFNGSLQSRHLGVDIDGKRGDPLIATNDGVVVLAAKDFYYIGNAVLLDHGDGLFSVYFHMQELAVEQGQRVQRGQLLGSIGATGRVTGPHVHFGFKYRGVYIDPNSLLRYRPEPKGDG